jgi:F-type H+-transporting ATPase subunit epsilon
VTTLTPGRLSYRGGSEGREWVVDAGFCEISGDVVTVLADSAQEPGDVDREAALELKREAEEQLLAAEVALVERAREQLALAEARLEVGD